MARFSHRAALRASTAAAAILYCTIFSGASHAAAQDRALNIPAASLSAALSDYSRSTGQQILVEDSLIRGLRTQGLKGAYSTKAALDQLLAGTGLTWRQGASGAIAIMKATAAPQGAAAAESAELVEEVLVTGSRIRGVAGASPTIIISTDDMRSAGQANLGEAVRSVPQNFGGGQNPGIGQGVLGSENVNSSSTLNLRGLGADATLTLLNGKRLAYDGPGQGVDISAIPIAAVDRVEIVADGASAIYGSDAVGGVANVILKRDYNGLETSVRAAGSTDGGNRQRQLSVVAGQAWDGGGVIATIDRSSIGEIVAGQRRYTKSLEPSSILTPEQEQFSATASVHQVLAEWAELHADGLYNKRKTSRDTPTTASQPVSVGGLHVDASVSAYTISPELIIQLPKSWQASVGMTFANSTTRYDTTIYANSVAAIHTIGSYDNDTRVGELNLEGPIFTLPAGDLRIALGSGYRDNNLIIRQKLITGAQSGYSRGRDSWYIFSELYLPLVSPSLDVWGVDHLSLTGAVRYENYGEAGEVATPKLGLIYAPNRSLEFKASWGRSFKAPRLTQQFDANSAGLYPISAVGGVGPAGATALTIGGGNPDLKPEKAETWSATVVLRPQLLPRARIEVSYFNIAYRDRVGRPIATISQSLSDPVYSHLLTFAPTAAQVASVINNSASLFLSSGAVFNPATIAVIIDNRNRNLAQQKVDGLDATAHYAFELSDLSSIDASVSASYLNSDQQQLAGRPFSPLSGTIFNPPKYRMRAGLTWRRGDLTTSGYVNSYSDADDRRLAVPGIVKGQTTIDGSIDYRSPVRSGLLKGLRVTLAATNIFNEAPPTIRTTQASYTPYESTNGSPAGRVVSLTLSKAW